MALDRASQRPPPCRPLLPPRPCGDLDGVGPWPVAHAGNLEAYSAVRVVGLSRQANRVPSLSAVANSRRSSATIRDCALLRKHIAPTQFNDLTIEEVWERVERK